MRSKLVVANWKMNGSCQFLSDMADSLKSEESNGFGSVDEVVICPPAIYISALHNCLAGSDIKCGAQNLSHKLQGAYTGEISAEMLSDVGCEWVIVGHSERRALYGEANELVAEKVSQSLASGLNTIFCVGETLEQREAGETKKIISEQIAAVLNAVNLSETKVQFVIAYEPVWAIGTGETATPEQAQEIHQFIRVEIGEALASTSILYGGSVKPSNAAELFAQPDIDGGLIGGAALIAEDFINICRAMPS